MWVKAGFLCAVVALGGLLGAGFGLILAAVAPGFLHGLLQADASARKLGIGVGIANGLWFGLIVGIAILSLQAWEDHRNRGRNGPRT